MRRRLILVCLAAALAAGAQAPRRMGAAETLDGIAARYNRPETIQLQFRQTYKFPGRMPIVESGSVYIRKPKRMRWDYDQPAGKLFLMDGQSAYLYTPRTSQVEKTPIRDTGDLRAAPLAFLMGRVDLRRDFKEFRYDQQGGDMHIVALPQSEKSPFKSVEFLVSPDFRILKLVVNGVDQSVMSFEFSGEQDNPQLAAGLFEFQMPTGAQLIEYNDEGGAN